MRWIVLLATLGFLALISADPRAAKRVPDCSSNELILLPDEMVTVSGTAVDRSATTGLYTTDAGLAFDVGTVDVVPLDSGVLMGACRPITGQLLISAIDPFGDGGVVVVQVEGPP